jgi:hypothetical protein
MGNKIAIVWTSVEEQIIERINDNDTKNGDVPTLNLLGWEKENEAVLLYLKDNNLIDIGIADDMEKNKKNGNAVKKLRNDLDI